MFCSFCGVCVMYKEHVLTVELIFFWNLFFSWVTKKKKRDHLSKKNAEGMQSQNKKQWRPGMPHSAEALRGVGGCVPRRVDARNARHLNVGGTSGAEEGQSVLGARSPYLSSISFMNRLMTSMFSWFSFSRAPVPSRAWISLA